MFWGYMLGYTASTRVEESSLGLSCIPTLAECLAEYGIHTEIHLKLEKPSGKTGTSPMLPQQAGRGLVWVLTDALHLGLYIISEDTRQTNDLGAYLQADIFWAAFWGRGMRSSARNTPLNTSSVHSLGPSQQL